jgi:hypothetical protein
VSVLGTGASTSTKVPVADCAQCAKTPAHHRRAAFRDDVLPWTIALTAAVVAACVGIGSERWFGIGVVAGLLAGGGCAWFTVRETLRARSAVHDRAIHELEQDADQRVASVIRQFEWSVNDIVRLKRDADRAALTADLLTQRNREREERVHKLERELAEAREHLAITLPPRDVATVAAATTPGIPFSWAMHHDGYGVNLELQCSLSVRATRVRILDRDGAVALVSGTPMYSDDGVPAFTLARPPVALLVDLETGVEPAYRLQALVDLQWMPMRLQDTGRRTKAAFDQRGTQHRVPTAAPSQATTTLQ